MRSDLPDAVADAIARCERPALVFDRARLEANFGALAASARAHRITALFAAKSFPHPEVWAMAAKHCDGFDAASAGEVAALPSVRVLSIVDPTGRASADRRERLIVGCETVAQVERAPANAEIAIRVSASITGRDPAIGAVLDGTGHRRSRFGVESADEVRAMARAADGRPVGLHVHHGPITATSAERFVATARAALALADIAPRFVDVGGAWHAIADIDAAFAKLRAAVPDIEIIVEPGRAIAREAGFACGRVVSARELADRSLRVVDLSRSCHLRWSQVELVGNAPHPGTGRDTLVVGATCYEDDVIGEWTVAPSALDEGARVVLRGVTGYAVAWNTSFGGVPAADVVLV
ncbi:MAG: hypothetical protein AB7T06_27000 [Kofleriaceae bacterium]